MGASGRSQGRQPPGEVPWNPSGMEQRNGRIDRELQPSPPTSLHRPPTTDIRPGTGFPATAGLRPADSARAVHIGNPVRPAVIAAAAIGYPPLVDGGMLQLLVFGGSQGARVMADVVPLAIERLEQRLQMRLKIIQQAREEDLERVRETYAKLNIAAKVEPFFKDEPQGSAQE